MSSAHRSPEGTDVRAKENDNGAGILILEPNNGLFIAPMSSPTQVSRNGVRISSPTLSWERQGGAVNEGPYAI